MGLIPIGGRGDCSVGLHLNVVPLLDDVIERLLVGDPVSARLFHDSTFWSGRLLASLLLGFPTLLQLRNLLLAKRRELIGGTLLAALLFFAGLLVFRLWFRLRYVLTGRLLSLNRLFQVDMVKPDDGAELGGAVLEEIRAIVRSAVPDAKEKISYQIACFELNGRNLVHFGGWKKHVSLYPVPAGSDVFEKSITKYLDGKGTLKFPLDEPLPVRLIERVVKLHLRVNKNKAKGISK